MLAEKLDISPQSVSKWECGVGLPNVTLFPVIADVMQVPIEVLFGKQSSLCGRELLIAEVYTGEKKRECYENIINMIEVKVEYYKKKI